MSKKFTVNGSEVAVSQLNLAGDRVAFEFGGQIYNFSLVKDSGSETQLRAADGTNHLVQRLMQKSDGVVYAYAGRVVEVARGVGSRRSVQRTNMADNSVAPLAGVVRKLLVSVGEVLEAGATVAVMEAMKMQLSIVAPYAGRVSEILVKEGEAVSEGAELVRIDRSGPNQGG